MKYCLVSERMGFTLKNICFSNMVLQGEFYRYDHIKKEYYAAKKEIME